MVMHIGNINSEHSSYFTNDEPLTTTLCEKDLGVGSCSELGEGGHYKSSGHICMEKNYIPIE